MDALLDFVKRWFETSSKKQKWTAVFTIVGMICTAALLSMNGSAQTTRDPLGSTPVYFVGAFIKLLVVLLLIVASAIFARRRLEPGLHGKTVRQMRLVETVRLSPKQALHLVSIGDQQLLIGATDQNVTLITHVEQSLETSPAEGTNSQPSLEFGSVLQSLNLNLFDGPSK